MKSKCVKGIRSGQDVSCLDSVRDMSNQTRYYSVRRVRRPGVARTIWLAIGAPEIPWRCWFFVLILLAPAFITDAVRHQLLPLMEATACHKATFPLLLCLMGLLLHRRQGYRLPSRHANARLVGILVFGGFITVTSIVRGGALSTVAIRTIEIVLPVLVALELVHQLRDRRECRMVWSGFVWLFGVYIIVALLWWFLKLRSVYHVAPDLNYVRMRSTLSGPVTLGYLMASVLPIVVIESRRWRTGVAIVILSSFAATILLTGSRMAAIVSVMMLVLFTGSTKHWRMALGLLLAITIAIVLLLVEGSDLRRYESLETVRFSSHRQGLTVWTEDLPTLLIGKGLGKYYPYNDWFSQAVAGEDPGIGSLFIDVDRNAESLVEPHSLYIWLLVETGLLGAGLYVGFLMVPPLLRSLRSITVRDRWSESLPLGLAMSVLGIMVTSLAGSFLLNEPPVAVVSWFAVISLDQWTEL